MAAVKQNLAESLDVYFNAGFAGHWVLTLEPEEVILELQKLAARQKYSIATWDIARGLMNPLVPSANVMDPKTRNPLAPFSFSKGTSRRAIVCLWNYHMFLREREVVQGLYNAILQGQQDAVHYVILSCQAELPKELEKAMVLHHHNLPNDEEITAIANNLTGKDSGIPLPPPLVQAARGLTRREVENACALSLARIGNLNAETIVRYKSESVRKSGFLTFHDGDESFANICGLDQLKWFTTQILNSSASIQSKGILLLGPPGTGKSKFAKALGKEVNRPVLLCDLSKIYSKHVGETEANLREVIGVAESIGPCILFIDEIEKALGGVNSDGDSGVSKRVFGKLLTWLSDKTSDVFVIGTCNNVATLPAEFSRAGRFDGLFFIDLPSKEEREKLWSYYTIKYSIPILGSSEIDDTGWTGAEIEECVKKSCQLGIPLREAARYIIPVSVSRREDIQKLQEWSQSRCMAANYPGRYVGEEPINKNTQTVTTRRTVNAKAGNG